MIVKNEPNKEPPTPANSGSLESPFVNKNVLKETVKKKSECLYATHMVFI